MTLTSFEDRSEGLVEGVSAHPGLFGLVLLGSASDAGAGRRDEWSDHDFFALVEPGRGTEVRLWAPVRAPR